MWLRITSGTITDFHGNFSSSFAEKIPSVKTEKNLWIAMKNMTESSLKIQLSN